MFDENRKHGGHQLLRRQYRRHAEKVSDIIRDILNTPELPLDITSSTETVAEWDSLAAINILTAVSQDFDIELGVDDFEKFTSIEGILDVLGNA